jgi:putative hydrolase of the HAD superfamily
VREISRIFKIGVVSNGLPDVQYQKLETIGLRHLFNCIILSEEIGIRKPDPRIFSHAASLLQIPPQECLYVGDSCTNDIVGARNAGMQTCWLNRKQKNLNNKDQRADLIITGLEKLGELLETKRKIP